jgi:hypothetical protein
LAGQTLRISNCCCTTLKQQDKTMESFADKSQFIDHCIYKPLQSSSSSVMTPP